MRKLIIAASFIGFIACDKPATTTTTTTTTADGTAVKTTATGTEAQPAAVVGDDHILATIIAINKSEVDQANAAADKLTGSGAKEFASDMAKHHAEAVEKLTKLGADQHIVASEGTLTSALKDDSAAVVAKLKADASGPLYDRTYMQSQVDGHAKALKLLDEKLIPAVKNPELKSTLTSMHEDVARHLSRAQDVLAKLPQGA